jgi:ankyrin repeat protein
MSMLPRVTVVALFAVSLSAQISPPASDALFDALRRGTFSEVERLLAAGTSANSVDTQGTPALMLATLFADARMVELLLKHGADPNRPDASAATALMWGAQDAAKVRLLLARGADVNARSKSDRTALVVAASYPRTGESLRLLIGGGADIRVQGAAALSAAVRSADVEAVRFLVDRGVDLNALAPATLRSAYQRHDRATNDYLASKALRPGADLLASASSWHSVDQLRRWADAGADVNARVPGQYGRTPLLTAVTSEDTGVDTIRFLLDRGADPNALTTEGESPLDWATYKGDRAKIQALEARGAKRGTGPRQEAIPPPATSTATDPRTAVTRGVARVLEVAPKFREQAFCVSCHHNAMPALAAATARRKGIDVNQAQARRNLDDMFTFFETAGPRMMAGDPAVGGEALTAGYVQMALAAEHHPLAKVTATIAHWLLARQMPDGSWLGNGVNRPPSEYSTISHTAIAAGALKAFPLPGRATEIDASLRRAGQWLLAARPASAEEHGMRLLGLVWTGAPRARIDGAIRDIRARQEASGGWSQFGRTGPDAYATGLSLYAMHLAGVPAANASFRKGVAFLLSTQYADGAWLVKTHAFPVQPYFESGFPFGRHQWISAAGTSWAAMAIAQTLPDKSP